MFGKNLQLYVGKMNLEDKYNQSVSILVLKAKDLIENALFLSKKDTNISKINDEKLNEILNTLENFINENSNDSWQSSYSPNSESC